MNAISLQLSFEYALAVLYELFNVIMCKIHYCMQIIIRVFSSLGRLLPSPCDEIGSRIKSEQPRTIQIYILYIYSFHFSYTFSFETLYVSIQVHFYFICINMYLISYVHSRSVYFTCVTRWFKMRHIGLHATLDEKQ